VESVRKFYRGPTDEDGGSLYNGGQPYGSELGWPGAFMQPVTDTAAPGDTVGATVSLSYLKNMAFVPNPPDSFRLDDVRFTDREFRRLNKLGDAIYNASDPDLRAFAAHGGKLILYHGWADPAIPPWSTLDYYAAVERTMGRLRRQPVLLPALHDPGRLPLPVRTGRHQREPCRLPDADHLLGRGWRRAR
jgi:hypothetical protein